jgi:predicted nucleotide-binding protein
LVTTPEEMRAAVGSCGYRIGEERTINEADTQLRLTGVAAIVNVYRTGTWNVQGREKEAVETALRERLGEGTPAGATAPTHREVFVVYGHDLGARNELEAMLRRWGCEPLLLDQLVSGGMTLIEKLEVYRNQAQFAVVLATADDVGYPKDHEDQKAFRARQNVVLELGMMLTLLGRDRVVILLEDVVGMEKPSDIEGLIYISFRESVEETKALLAREMANQASRIHTATTSARCRSDS